MTNKLSLDCVFLIKESPLCAFNYSLPIELKATSQ